MTVVAGIWNIVAGISRIRFAGRILARDPNVPAQIESIGQLVVIGIVNAFFGAAIGLVGVAADIFIRAQVLKNRRLFEGPSAITQLATPR